MLWKTIGGFEDYEVSESGQVRSFKSGKAKVLKGSIHTGGYSQVVLWRDGEKSTQAVHRLVANAFLGPRPDGMQVRHLDGNPANSHVSNLAYGTPSENMQDKHLHGTMRTSSCWYKDSLNQQIVSMVTQGKSLPEISNVLGACMKTIGRKFKQATGMTIREWRRAA